MITSQSSYQQLEQQQLVEQQRHLLPLTSTLSPPLHLHDEVSHPIPQSRPQSHFVARQYAASVNWDLPGQLNWFGPPAGVKLEVDEILIYLNMLTSTIVMNLILLNCPSRFTV
jgi:hypothetical protein